MSTTLNDFGRARLRLVQEAPASATKPEPAKRPRSKKSAAAAQVETQAQPTAAQQERLRQAILALVLEDCGLTVEQALQECSERAHEVSTATFARVSFLNNQIANLGLHLHSVNPDLELSREFFLHLWNPKALLAKHPELAHLDPEAHTGLTLG